MDSVSLTEAEGRLSELIDRVQAGEDINITRDGKAVARLSALAPVPKPKKLEPIDIEALRKFTDSMPRSKQSAVDLVRAMRDDGY